ncbi:DNA-binding protein [bacterium]|nr:DNA-binding protein [bacterium]
MCKLRTIPKAYDYIKKQDPDSGITLYMIRKLAEQEKISVTKTGRKILVDVDSLMAFLSGEKISPCIIKIA